ncbi:hypothetical protein CANARDRAFT_203532 [[Candida] arabinofermentans NRRL YB-2248]|uniref:Methyltransferase type 11 domain-containing protein n=1 Tax=[Candida] arabinofermentans NRRL YB-2248 TaxID=983967 RepID=A0A1E4SUR4_9ASCO|nr:hypothetical protein CANARDRAFT_203532 [[Candida] arabinofermentans NRRL YB-2248]
MSAFSDKSFNASNYSKFRPTYPKTFYDALIKYHLEENLKEGAGKLDTLVDVGCGPGEAFLPLVSRFDRIIGTDLSQVMVDQAQVNFDIESKANETSGKGEFHVASSDDMKSVVNDGEVDIVLAAQCAHWFDRDGWFDEMFRILKPNGTLAYLGYVDPIFVGYPKANEIYEEMVYVTGNYLGPYWEQPGRSKLRNLLRDLNDKLLQDDRFYDTKVTYLRPDIEETPSALTIEQTMTLENYFAYGRTWSSSHKWMQAHPDTPIENQPFTIFYNRLNKAYGWTMDTKVKIAFRTVYTFARRIPK